LRRRRRRRTTKRRGIMIDVRTEKELFEGEIATINASR